jgi:hypothetical protein
MYGGACDLNRGFLTPMAAATAADLGIDGFEAHEYIVRLHAQHQRLVAAAAAYQVQVVDKRLAHQPGETVATRVFLVGDFVVVSHPDRPPTKLSPPWFGPLQVIEADGTNSVRCRDLVSGKIRHLHVARLRLFNAARCAWPVEVAAADVGEFAVSEIVDHRNSDDGGLEFRVRWKDYSADDDTWMPFSRANDLVALDAYLADHPELHL